jgi:hypothetical protein
VERVFSVTQNIWNNENNRLKVEMVKAELLENKIFSGYQLRQMVEWRKNF